MYCEKGLALILGYFLFLCSVNGQAQGPTCQTPDQRYGVCISLLDCPPLITLLQTQSQNPQVVSYLRGSTCGYINTTPKVCCPQGRALNPTTRPVTSENTNSIDTTDEPEMRNPTGETMPLLRYPECGNNNGSLPRVVGGVPARLGEHPWMVALGYKNANNPNQPKWLCGATLITEKHILTAAHCVHNRNDLYLARLGDLDLYSTTDGASPVDIPLMKAKIHEDYDPVAHVNDIAILTMSRKVERTSLISPICLPQDEPLRSSTFVNNSLLVAGWGALYFNGPTSTNLQEVSVPVLDNAACKRVFEDKGAIIDNRIICAGHLTGGKDSCKGDSGGPLMAGYRNHTKFIFYQAGVVSYGFKCAEAGYPGVYTRVTNYIEWIKRNLN